MHSVTAPQACRNWAFLGRCDYGDSCPYVHNTFSPLDSVPGSSGAITSGPLTGILASITGEFRPFRAYPAASTLGGTLNQEYLISAIAQRERILSTSPFLLPELIQNKYHSLLQLDSSGGVRVSAALGKLRTTCYKALSANCAAVVCLRRVEGFMHLSNYDLVQETVGKWSSVGVHPNVVTLRSAFVTQEFQEVDSSSGFTPHGVPASSGGSLVWVYDYIDQAITLEQYLAQAGRAISEQFFVDVLLQGLAGLAFVHANGLALRCVGSSKLLLSGMHWTRVHWNCAGILDVLVKAHPSGHSSGAIADAQLADLAAFGKLLDELRPGGAVADAAVQSVLAELTALNDEATPASSRKSVTAASLIAKLGTAYAARCAETLTTSDAIMTEYRKGVDLGRTLDVLLKVNAVVDRPSLFEDWRWAMTGDRFIVSLFRDYMFFQQNEFGSPVVDVGHTVDALTKVDAGSTESVMLMSRDGASVLVVSYLDIRRALDNSFRELLTPLLVKTS